jgi:lipopolysaccharide transport system ATP-binding protein
VAAVTVAGVSKKFRRGERHDSLRDLVPALAARLLGRQRGNGAEEFWALRDVSFEVNAGEALGIIGPNGAGKSTVLKLLTKILRPTSGQIAVRGRIGALIEVAAGFHPDLSGRENVYLQGAIMGMSRAEITRKFDSIVTFSGIEAFIDTPVKRYSSGMNARLGFSIAAHLDPDVLLIDEVLAVGDAAFQDQCLTRMRELIGRGMPLVFISHNLPAVLDLCSRVIVLEGGQVVFDGTPGAAVREYRSRRRIPTPTGLAATPGGIAITGAELLDEDGEESSRFGTGRAFTLRIRYSATRPVQANFAVDIFREDGVYCAGINTRMDRRDLGVLCGDGFVDLMIPNLWLVPGNYVATLGILDAQGLVTLDVDHRGCSFSVTSELKNLGLIYLARTWRHARAESSATVAKELA